MYYYFLVFLFCLSAWVRADEPEVQHLDTIHVEASRSAADAIDTDFQTGHVTVISHNDFDVSSVTLADLIGKQSGIQMRQVGGIGTYSSVSVRGSTDAQVNVYLDGIQINEAYGGSVDFSQFLLAAIERVEIYRSNAPVQLGASGIGGAINIVTRHAGIEDLKQVSVGLGSYETHKGALLVKDELASVPLLAVIDYVDSDNDYQLLNNNKTPDYLGDDFSDRRNNGQLTQYSALLAAQKDLSEETSLSLQAQHFNKDQHLPDHTNAIYNNAKLETEFTNVQLKADLWWRVNLASTAKFFFSEKEEFYDDRLGTLGVQRDLETAKTETFGLSLQNRWEVDQHTFSTNLELKQEYYEIDDLSEQVFADFDRSALTFGVQDEWLSQDGAWLLNGGARLFTFDDDSERKDASVSEDHQTYQLGAAYFIGADMKLSSNLSWDVRIPKLSEKFGDRGYIEGNEDLETEKATNFDLGVEWYSTQLTVRSSAFYRDLKDAVIIVFNARGIGQAQNLSKARVMGWENSLSYDLNSIHSIRIESTVQDSEELSESRQFGGGKSLPGVSRFENLMAFSTHVYPLTFTFEHEHRSGGYYDRRNVEPIKAVNQLNFRVKWSVHKHSLEFSVDNITGSEREEFNRFVIEGPAFFAQYQYVI